MPWLPRASLLEWFGWLGLAACAIFLVLNVLDGHQPLPLGDLRELATALATPAAFLGIALVSRRRRRRREREAENYRSTLKRLATSETD